jgi:hypothetical protein
MPLVFSRRHDSLFLLPLGVGISGWVGRCLLGVRVERKIYIRGLEQLIDDWAGKTGRSIVQAKTLARFYDCVTGWKDTDY